MDLNLLKVFILIMRTRSITQTAVLLDVSTPAASQALSRLRDHYNDRLFIRQGRSMHPTLFAENLYETIYDAYEVLDQHSKSNRTFSPELSNRAFRIACHQDVSSFISAPLLKYLAEKPPNTAIHFEVGHKNDEERQTALKFKKVDFILTTTELDKHSYDNELLYSDSLYVVYRKDHPRLKGRVDYDAFFNEQHILWRPQSSVITTLDILSTLPLPKRNSVIQVDSIYHALLLCAETDLICAAPFVMINKILSANPILNVSVLPFETNQLQFYLSMHRAHKSDQGAQWLKNAIIDISHNIKFGSQFEQVHR
ncbi:LysR family transcriptional regulator [Vibrio rumoiensis]|uniref:HTH lysR-type domain-containing protein n=1 Tax=Vibrio rumoiensis 1S-45 TaxID=1188252 RepID=A0A1E5E040_9VIBR|nr:LysR family transcriptional regulator [Vibrio rumoiensis]OEF23658.1 hypothetical protein A1QC_11145 [Vibrio rumoiensis 1S-45]